MSISLNAPAMDLRFRRFEEIVEKLFALQLGMEVDYRFNQLKAAILKKHER
jgi:hypothetical protein